MVKTTYALTLFTAVSLAAPLRQSGGSGGSENLIGAGTAGGKVNDVVAGLFKELTPRDSNDNSDNGDKVVKHGSLFEELPIIGSLFGDSKKQTRSFTGDLASLPLLGDLFGGDQAHPANTPNKHESRSHMPFFGEGQNYGQNHGQNHGQKYGQNAGQNAHQNEGQNHGQNYGQNYGQNAGQNEGQNEGQNYLQNYGQNHGQNDGQNEGQNYLQNHGQNHGQNYGQNHKRDLDLASLPIIGKYLGGDGKQHGPPNSHTYTETKSNQKAHIENRMEGSHGIEGLANPYSVNNLAETIPDGVADSTADTFEAGLGVAMDAIPLPVERRGLMQDLTALGGQRAEKSDDDQTPEGQSAEKTAKSGNAAEDKPAAKEDKPSGTSDAKPSEKSEKPNKPAKDNTLDLKEIAKEAGLDQLFSKNTQHGVGLFPMNGRRDTTIETRAAPPIQGSTLTDVLLENGALGKISHMLNPYAPTKQPGQSDATQLGDGSSMAPPGQPGSPAGSGAAGPHDGPGYAAEHGKLQH